MRIGVFGGTFDPIHTAHVAAADAARQQLRLDRVLFVVCGNPPDGHKTVAAYTQRLRMAEIALVESPWAEVSTAEGEERGPCYTADTVSMLKKRYPNDELYLIIGEDKLASFPHWYQAERILAETHIAVLSRDRSQLPEEICTCSDNVSVSGPIPHMTIRYDGGGVSSSGIRSALWCAAPTEHMLSPATERYIYEEGPYLPPEVTHMRDMLKRSLTASRYSHVMGTVRQSVRLAATYAPADTRLAKKARLAALLHDCAKQLPIPALCRLSGDAEPATEQVLHAFAGASLAKTVYGVRDDDVLRAIRLHCTGDREMSLLDMIIYLADLTEPGRSFPGVDRYREALPLGPERAMMTAVAGILSLLERQGSEVHPATLRAEAWLNKMP